MVEFKRGYWNLQELKIVEWIDENTEGYMANDISTLKEKIISDLSEFEFDDSDFSIITDVIKRRFG